MSTTIDEKVVSMRFDNSNFEKNVNTSMSTLDKLKAKFNFKKSADSLNGLGQAAQNNAKSMSEFENLSTKAGFHFSDVWQKVSTVFEYKVAGRIISAAENMVKSLTIDPVKEGFSEYEMTLNAIQTTMSATGKTAEEVEEQLKSLDEYADKTVYSTADMLNNLPKFTNAGVELEDATTAMIGIANAVALAGGGASQASSAFYNLGQAIGTGYLTRMDFNSINNTAGMATMEWKNQMVEAAIAAGTLTKAGEDLYTAGGKNFTLQQLFIDGLQHQWATTEVMMKVFKDYGNEQTAVGKKAYEAAQNIKTYTMMMDSLKATAGTGWKETWDIVVGDLEDATKMWTRLTNFISGIITTMADARNWLLEKALDFASPWKSIMDKLDASGLTKIGKAVSDVTDKLKYFQDIVSDVWIGNWKTSDTGRYELLDAAGYDHRVVQDLVNLGYGYQITIEDIEASHAKFGLTMDKTAESTQEVINSINNLTDEQLEAAGLTDKEIEMYKELAAEAKRTGRTVEDLAKEMSETSGRTHLIEGLANIGKSLTKVFSAMGKAWKEIFPPMSFITLYNALKSFRNFTEQLVMSDETADKLKRTFKGLFAIIDIVFTLVGGPVKLVLKIFASILKACGVTVLEFTAYIGDALVQIRDWIDHALDFTKIIKVMVDGIKNAWKSFKEWIKSLKGSDNLAKDIADGIWNGLIAAFKGIGKLFGMLGKWMFGWFSGVSGDSISGFVKGIWNSMKLIGQVMWELGKNIVNAICDFLGIHSPSRVFMAIGGFIIGGLALGLLKDVPVIGDAIKKVGSVITDFFGEIDFGKIASVLTSSGLIYTLFQSGKAIGGFGKMMGGAGDVMSGAAEVMEESATSIAYTIKQTGKCIKSFSKAVSSYANKNNSEALKNMAIAIGILVASIVVLTLIKPEKLWNAVAIVGVLAIILGALFIAITKLGSAAGSFSAGWKGIQGNFSGVKTIILQIGLTLLLLAASIAILGNMNPDKLGQGILALLGLFATLTIFLYAYGSLIKGKAAHNADKGGKLIRKIATTLLMMTLVMAILGNMDRDTLIQGGIALVVMGALIGILVGFLSSASGKSKSIDSAAKVISKFGIAMLLIAVAIRIIGSMKTSDLVLGSIFIGIFVAMIAALTYGITKAGTSSEIKGVAAIILSFGVAIAAMAIAVRLLGGLDGTTMLQGSLVVVAFIALMWLMVRDIIKIGKPTEIKGVALVLIAFSVAIAALAAVAVILGYMDLGAITQGVTAVTVLILAMKGVLSSLRGVDKGSFVPLIMLTVAIAAIAATVILFSKIEWSALWPAVAGLGTLMLCFSAILLACKNVPLKAMGPLGIMIAVVAALAAVIWGLTKLTDPKKAIKVTKALSNLMLALTVCLAALTLIGKWSGNAINGAIALLALCVPLVAVVGILILANNIKHAEQNVKAIASMVIALTGVLAALTIIGLIGSLALVGCLALLALCVPLVAVVGILILANNIKNAETNVLAIVKVLETMAKCLGILAAISLGIAVATVALTALTVVVTAIGALVLVLGALSAIPGFNWLLKKGIKALITLAEGIGEAVGAFVDGISSRASKSLPKLGTALSEFASGLGPFIEIMSNIPKSCGRNMFLLIGAIEELTDAAFLNHLMEKFGIDNNWDVLGRKLCDFAFAVRPIADAMADIPESAVDGVAILAEVIASLTDSAIMESFIDPKFKRSAGLSGYVDELSEIMPKLGNAILSFSNSVLQIPDDTLDKTSLCADILSKMATVAKELPNSGGLLGDIVGNNDIDVFASMLSSAADSVVSARSSLKELTDEDVTSAQRAADLITAFASIKIENTGGLLGGIVGNNDLDVFAENLPIVGDAVKRMCNHFRGGNITEDTLNIALKAAEVVAEMAGIKIVDNGDWITSVINQDSPLMKFCKNLPTIGGYMHDLCVKMDGVTRESLTAIDICAEIINAFSNLGNTLKVVKLTGVENAIAKIPEIFNGLLYGRSMGSITLHGLTDISSSDVESAKSVVDSIIDVLKSINNADVSNMDKVTSGVQNFNSIISSFKATSENLPDSVENISEFVDDLSGIKKDSITSAIGKIEDFIDLLKTITEADISNSTNFGTAIENLATGAINKFINRIKAEENVNSISSATSTTIEKAIDNAKSSTTLNNKLLELGKFVATGLALGIKNNKSVVTNAISEVTSATITQTEEDFDEHSPSRVFAGIGKYVVQGLAKGIHDNLGDSTKAAEELSSNLLTATQEALGIHSPSVVFKEDVGRWIVEGIREGIDEKEMDAEEKAKQMASNIREAFDEELNRSDMRLERLEIDFEGFKLRNPNATEEEIDKAYLTLLNNQVKESNKKAELLLSKRYAMESTFGKESDEYLEADNEYQKQLNEGFKIAEERTAYREEIGARTVDDLEEEQEVRELQSELWNERNRYATDAQRHTQEESFLLADLTTQRGITAELQKQYNDALERYGAEHDKTEDLYKKLIKSQTEEQKLENQLFDLDLSQYDQKIEDIEQDTRLRNLNYELWESKNKDADELVKITNQLAYLKKEAQDATKTLNVEKDKLTELEKAGGKETQEYKDQLEITKQAEINANNKLNEISDLEEQQVDIIKDRTQSTRDAQQELIDTEYSIWEKTTGKDATEEEKELKKLEAAQRKLNIQTQDVADAKAEYYRILEENNNDTTNHLVVQAALAWKQEVDALATLTSEIEDLEESIADRVKRAEDRRKSAQKEYKDYIERYRKYYLDNGYSLSDLEKDAQLVSGYDPTEKAKETVEKVEKSTNEVANNIVASGVSAGNKFAEGINEAISEGTEGVVTTAEAISEACVKALNGKYTDWKDTGTYLVNGLIRGIKNGKNKAVNAAVDLMRAVIDASNATADINSPSRVFEEMGMYLDMGLAEGLRKYSNLSEGEATNVGNSIIERFRSTIARISDTIDSEMDTQPTIRPVLDLSNVEAGTARLNTMFSHSQALSASAGIAERFAVEDQNGKESSAAPTTTYSFTQNNYSPKALSPTEIYRQTRNQFSAMKEALDKK